MKGAFCEILTSFHKDGSINHAEYAAMIEYQIEQGIDGFFINGEGAESLQLTNPERIEIAEAACARVKRRVPMIGGIVLSCRLQAVGLVEAYNHMDGIDAVCAVPPMTAPLSEKALYDFFGMLSSHSCKPVFLYNQPATGNLLSEDLVVKLSYDFDNIRGYKDATQNVIMLQSLLGKVKQPFSFFGGSDAFIWPMATLGCPCVISLLAVAFPKPVVEFYQLFEVGDYQAAYKKIQEIIWMREVLKKGFPRGSKAGYLYVTELLGVPIRGTRLPESYLDITDEQKQYIEQEARKYGWL